MRTMHLITYVSTPPSLPLNLLYPLPDFVLLNLKKNATHWMQTWCHLKAHECEALLLFVV